MLFLLHLPPPHHSWHHRHVTYPYHVIFTWDFVFNRCTLPRESWPELLGTSSSLHLFPHRSNDICILCNLHWNTATNTWGIRPWFFLIPISTRPPSWAAQRFFLRRWTEALRISKKPPQLLALLQNLCYKGILKPLRWGADTPFNNTQPTPMQSFSLGALQRHTRKS